MSRREFALASAVLRVMGWLFAWLPLDRRRVVLATARLPVLEGNLLFLDAAIRRAHPDARVVHLLEPYAYGLAGKVRYMLRLVRGMYHLRTAGLVVVDNAWLPVHVAPHRRGTTVVQVWHAAGALKRFGADAATPLAEPEQTFLHRYYDYAIASGEAGRGPWSRALRTPLDRVLALGTPRTDFFFDSTGLAAARERLLAAYPELAGRRVVLYAPTFRGRGRDKYGTAVLDGSRLRARLPAEAYALVMKSHPNVDSTGFDTSGFDVVADPGSDMNEWLALADVFVTDYSSSIFEWALLRRPLVLLIDDLETYERDPGLYLDYRTEMIGVAVRDTDQVADAILADDFDLTGYDAFINRNLGASDGHASDRFVEQFLPGV